MYPRSQEAAIARATETQTQVISAFGAKHPLSTMAGELLKAITDEAKATALAPPVMPEPGPK